MTAAITSTIDIYSYYTRFSIFNWICFYWSGIAVCNSMIHTGNIINAAAYNYELLNLYLDKYTHKDLTPSEQFKMSEKHETPLNLMQRFQGSQYTIFHKVFIIYNEISRTVRLANKVVGRLKSTGNDCL